MAVGIFSSPRSGECHGSIIDRPGVSTRMVVQTESGCVLGLDLDRRDNAHTVKRRLQLALNIPTDESSLNFGDLTLNKDLNSFRNDSQLLSRNGMLRSLPTPCLSPTARNLQQKDQSGTVEILGHSGCNSKTKELVEHVVKAIRDDIDPMPVNGGLGGAYYFKNCKGDNIAIVKPTDEEPFAPNNPKGFVGKALGQPGLKPSVRVGETGFREVVAYLLDYDHFANVPPTVLVKVEHSMFNVNDPVNGNKIQSKKKVTKIASLQQYIPHDFDASDHGTSSFPVAAVHRIGILDIRIFNTDRHAGNILVRKLDGIGKFGRMELIPIDHGLCLPESLEDPYFEWIHWPQASVPFSEDELEYIRKLDPFKDSQMLRMELPMIREACLRVLVLCTIFLQEAAAFGMCLSEIGEMMTREVNGQDEDPSELEVVCLEARMIIRDREMSLPEAEGVNEEFLFDLDCEDPETNLDPKLSGGSFGERSFFNGSKAVDHQYLMPELDETFEDEPGVAGNLDECYWFQAASKSSKSKKNTNFGKESQLRLGSKAKGSFIVGSLSMNRRSANELLPASIIFVKLADMNEEEWSLFLERFKCLLHPAFAKRRSLTIQRQRQRFGTSCQF